MLAKYLKKICILILIIACIFNIMLKLIQKVSLNTELVDSAKYVYEHDEENKK